jgi:hypothetical protein
MPHSARCRSLRAECSNKIVMDGLSRQLLQMEMEMEIQDNRSFVLCGDNAEWTIYMPGFLHSAHVGRA